MRALDEIDQVALLLCIMAVVVFSLAFPWSFRTSASRRLAHLPLSLLLLYPAYEATMPPDTNIRIDLLFLWPAFVLIAVCYGIKLLLLSHAASADGQHRTGELPAQPGSDTRWKPPADDMGGANERLAHLLRSSKNGQKS